MTTVGTSPFEQKYYAGERVLGEGMSGPVLLYYSRDSNMPVAVKTLVLDNIPSSRHTMLLSEVEIYLRVSHPNVVKLIEVFEEPGKIHLIMEVCTGGELYERLASRERYDEQTASRVTRQMLSAVAYLHSLQICHRDLKLENWLYQDSSDDSSIKLCDFGFGSFVHRDTFLTATLGSVHYVAPEVLAGQYGLSCDVWSIGVIVYMLLSGAPPFDGHNDKAIMAQVRSGKFAFHGKLWETVSENAKDFITALLRVDPHSRLSAEAALEHPWLQTPSAVSAAIDRQVLDSLHAFASAAALQRAALGLLLAGSVGAEELKRLAGELSLADSAKSGRITAERFSEIMEPSLKPETRETFRALVAGAGADAPLPYREVLIAAAAEERPVKRLTRVHSGPSESTVIYQPPGFYKSRLRPFYASHPVSNLVLGLVTGTSSFARAAWRLGLTRIGRLANGGFFLLPNPKFHAEPGEVQRFEGCALRFVVWWVAEEFFTELEEWHSQGVGKLDEELGGPGDFRFSRVRKSDLFYLHTYRDLEGVEGVALLSDLSRQVDRFLKEILGDEFVKSAVISQGFHFPVRTQYSTLHMQIRINSGSVVGADGRGISTDNVMDQLRKDPLVFARDDKPLRYRVTENIKSNLVSAAEGVSKDFWFSSQECLATAINKLLERQSSGDASGDEKLSEGE